jgi:isochorismate synthase EntC
MAELSSMTHSVNKTELKFDLSEIGLQERFWRDGAFLRLAKDQFFLAVGPWKPVSEAEAHLGVMDFFASNPVWLKADRVGLFSEMEIRRFLESQLGSKTLNSAAFGSADKAGFENAFRLIQGKIQREEIEKAVPIVRRQSSQRPSVSDLAHGLMTSLSLPLTLNTFGFWKQGNGCLGASPELLFQLEGNKLTSMALAGSCPKEDLKHRVPLLKDPKEMKEHTLVVEDLAARLKPLGWLRQGPTQVLELPTLVHLQTEFEVSGCAKLPSELIRHLHPTAALAVAPRHYGFQWLRDLPDQAQRGAFGSPLTFNFSAGKSRSLVTIRSLFWNEQGSSVFAGCGIVAASRFEQEWEELEAKLNSVFRVLGLD